MGTSRDVGGVANNRNMKLRRPVLLSSRTESSILPTSLGSPSFKASANKRNSHNNDDNSSNDNNNNLSIGDHNIQARSKSTTNLEKLGRSELSHGFRSEIKTLTIEPALDLPFYNNIPNSSHNSSTQSSSNVKSHSNISNQNQGSSSNSSTDNVSDTRNSYYDNEALLVDVLPSFEMYNALHRHIPQGNVDPDRHDFPPSYAERQQQQRPHNTHDELNDLHVLNTVHYAISDDVPFQDDLNDNDNINIDKLYSLPKLTTSPIDIDIRITKNAAKPHTLKYEEQSMLKEYTSGDIIHGYCIISNQSSHRIKFEMFYVTLEGYISLVDQQKGKRTVKRFIRMVDLSASWSYTDIDLSSGIDIMPGENDNYDGSIIGLKNSRVLEPHSRYKKFFMFKLPTQLLDVTCKHEHHSHCLLPPSFGIDKFKNHFIYSDIKINNVLGCGHMGIKGSPILTNDLSGDDISINYTIDARIVGKNVKSQKLNLMKEKEFNLRIMPFNFKSNSSLSNNSSSSNCKNESVSDKQVVALEKLIDERFLAFDKVFERLSKKEPIINSDIHGTDLSGTFDTDTELNSEEILQRKLNQLHVNNRLDDAHSLDLMRMKNMFPKANTVEAQVNYRFKSKNKSSKGKPKTLSPHVGNNFFSGFLGSSSSLSSSTSGNYKNKNKNVSDPASKSTSSSTLINDIKPVHSASKAIKSLLSSPSHIADKVTNVEDSATFSTSPLPPPQPQFTTPSSPSPSPTDTQSSTPTLKENLGLIILTTHIPKRSLPYCSPSLLKKTNKFDLKNKHDQENWLRLSDLVPDEERDPLANIPINLTCLLSNNSALHEPPNLQSISIKLIALTVISDNSIPIKLNTQFLMNESKLNNIKKKFQGYYYKIMDYKTKFEENVIELNELFNIGRTLTTARQLQFKDFISVQLLSDIESIMNLEVQHNELNDVFKKPVIDNVHESNNLNWASKDSHKFEASLDVKLDLNQNIKETIIPNFESCLCGRFYCLDINVKFENHFGSTSIKIPVDVKKFKS